MAEWHVTPDYIVNNWTDELLDLMIEKLVERRKAQFASSGAVSKSDEGKVSDKMLFSQARNLVKVVNRGN